MTNQDISWRPVPRWEAGAPVEDALSREWIVTNGLGGYASGTQLGVDTRRYHGPLVAALPAPLGRVLMLAHVAEEVALPGGRVLLTGFEVPGEDLAIPADCSLETFGVEAGLPVWVHRAGDARIEKRVMMPHGQNTVHLSYRLRAGDPVVLRLRPYFHIRSHDGDVGEPPAQGYPLTVDGPRFEVHGPAPLPPVRLLVHGARWVALLDGGSLRSATYRREGARGYNAEGRLWSPGAFDVRLATDGPATLVASCEPWEALTALEPEAAWQAELGRRRRLVAMAPEAARSGPGAELVLAADQFLVVPASRRADAARADAQGDVARTVIAGYHWFTDWGRDTMISLEGLALCTGRWREAGAILRTFAAHVRDGLIPNLFPEGSSEGLYHTADATLWFVHAVARYGEVTGDRETVRRLLPTLLDIVERHVRGTRFGIGVDERDGLLRQGSEGVQLTWMDAKVGDWVVTPRRGKAVEINALWYNALRLLEGIALDEGDPRAQRLGALAGRAYESFNRRFWYADGGHLYDVVDGEAGDDPALRPNQLFAVALPHAVLAEDRWAPVVQAAERELLTPVGLRTLAPGHPDYKERYFGDLRARDAAYHQGTVWPWLIGPYVDAWLRVNPGQEGRARVLLRGLVDQLGEACAGSIAEIFDATEPTEARGCVAQAWSVAELLRCWVRTGTP